MRARRGAAVRSRPRTHIRTVPRSAIRRVGRSLRRSHPQLAREWHPHANGPYTPDDVSFGCGYVVTWVCPKGPDHVWEQTVNARTNRRLGCPACAGHQLSVTNSLTALFPEVARQWHPTRNGDRRACDAVAKSNDVAWWKCDHGPGHEWQAAIVDRTCGSTGCPACAGRQVSVTNSLAARHPDVAAQWHPTLNDSTPSQFVRSSHAEVFWRCPRGADHVWKASITSRTVLGRGCPMCAGRQASATNSLAELYPEVAETWDVKRNGARTPSNTTAYSQYRAWWCCPRGRDHRWSATVASRTSGGNGCPACAGRQLADCNRLSIQFPDVAAELHPTRNGGVRADTLTVGSTRKLWWRCPNDRRHVWLATVANRTRRGQRCPRCSLKSTSAIEIRLAHEIAAFLPVDHAMRSTRTDRYERVDIAIPDLGMIIEFDSEYWHRDREAQDLAKTIRLMDAGLTVIRVREQPLRPLGPHDVLVPRYASVKALANAVLTHIEATLGIVVPGLASYLSSDALVNARPAQRVIARAAAC